MTTPRITSFESIEIHLAYYEGFARKFGVRVRAASGTYSECRGHQTTRYITLSTHPLNHKLINDLLWECKASVVMLRHANQDVLDRVGTTSRDWVMHLDKVTTAKLVGYGNRTPIDFIEEQITLRLGTPAQASKVEQARKQREEQFAATVLARAAQARADALTKAAPGLLAALRAVVSESGANLHPATYQQALAAITAATGELTEAA